MRYGDQQRARLLDRDLTEFSRRVRPLPGIVPVENRVALIEQFLESIRRVEYVHVIRDKSHSDLRANPSNEIFDPLRAAALHRRWRDPDEACWLIFLATHFGKNKKTGWRLLQDVYGALGDEPPWTWQKTTRNPDAFSAWLDEYYDALTTDGIPRHFGNHRKYETLRPSSEKGTGAVVSSYVHWVLRYGDHQGLFTDALERADGEPRKAFRRLYESMSVLRFGRTAKFDYLTMIAKMGLASIQPDSAYLVGATGPLRGARLLFAGTVAATHLSAPELDDWLLTLADALDIGMQEMEDALCNWQKTPGRFVRFRG